VSGRLFYLGLFGPYGNDSFAATQFRHVGEGADRHCGSFPHGHCVPAIATMGLMGIIVTLIARAMLPTHALLDGWRRGLCLSPNFGRAPPIHGRNPPTP
jgi:hypothetical protein